jgi:hypothetical protein
LVILPSSRTGKPRRGSLGQGDGAAVVALLRRLARRIIDGTRVEMPTQHQVFDV